MSEPADDPLTMEEACTFRVGSTLIWCGFWGWMALVGFCVTCHWVWEHVAP